VPRKAEERAALDRESRRELRLGRLIVRRTSWRGRYISIPSSQARQKRQRACSSQEGPHPLCTSSHLIGTERAGSPHSSGNSRSRATPRRS